MTLSKNRILSGILATIYIFDTFVSGVVAASRYSPVQVAKVEKTMIYGMPDINTISTSHVEKQNYPLRMRCRRFIRLTNAFSKKFENFKAAVALNFAYYNFCKIHGPIRMNPAIAASVEKAIREARQ